jgi:hypothetical protein
MGKMKDTLPELQVDSSEVYATMTLEEFKKLINRPISDELAEEMSKCSYCVDRLRKGDKDFPRHNASMNCESGGDSHCSCDICY